MPEDKKTKKPKTTEIEVEVDGQIVVAVYSDKGLLGYRSPKPLRRPKLLEKSLKN